MKPFQFLSFTLGFILFFAFKGGAFSQENYQVTFQLVSPELPNDSAVFITGNQELLGGWNPMKIEMKNQGSHIWSKTIVLDHPVDLEYKFTRGSWDTEGLEPNGQPFPNFTAHVSGDTLLTQFVYQWKTRSSPAFKGKITGTVRYHQQLTADSLLPRDVVVWLPPEYDLHPEKYYPVLYMHDGQNLFNPATSSFGVDWQVDESCDSLIEAKLIEPLIIVGIYNTSDRMTEYIPGPKGTEYMKFVVNQVKPLIDKTYRTKTDREHTFVGGSSAGGIISFMMGWEYPQVFSKAICMSPAFKIEDIDYVKTVNSGSGPKKDLFFYIDNGGVGLENLLQPGVDDMMNALKLKGYQQGKDFIWVKDSTADHNERSWAKRFPNAIQIIMNGANASK